MDEHESERDVQQRYYQNKVEALKIRRGLIEAKPLFEPPGDQNEPEGADERESQGDDDPEAHRRRLAAYGLAGSIMLALLSGSYLWLHAHAQPKVLAQTAPTSITVWATLDAPQLDALRQAGMDFAAAHHLVINVQSIPDLQETLPEAIFAHVEPDAIVGGRAFLDHLARLGELAAVGTGGAGVPPAYALWLSAPASAWAEPLGLAVLRAHDQQDVAERQLARDYVAFVASRLRASSSRSTIKRQI